MMHHWEVTPGCTNYIGEQATTITGPWIQFYVGKKSSATASGLASGSLNFFRVCAVGAGGPGPWSNIAQNRAT